MKNATTSHINESATYHKHLISLYVSNQPGVLIRIALVFAKRGYNIDSLVVSTAEDPRFSRMNIVASGDKKTLEQILKQLNKLVDVISAKDHTGENIVERELSLIKVNCTTENRTEIVQIASAFNAKTIDLSEKTITFEVVGDSAKLDAFQKLMEKYEIDELVRTGKVIISRGMEHTS